jgi:DNA-directed RNA polymerase subunit alpha
VQYYELGKEIQQTAKKEDEEEKQVRYLEELDSKLSKPIEELDLSVRASNCLQNQGVKTLADLVKLTERDMLQIRNLGKTSLKEIKKKLADIGLALGMNVDTLKQKAEA